jgi:glycerophosphoryl diester phosphodiesterase
MVGVSAWQAPPENTLESLRHAMVMFDGIEFDLRITADKRLIVHHDRDVSVPPELLRGRPLWVEEWEHDDLVDLGFLSFEDLLQDETVVKAWRDQGKMGCIEIKRPHPKAASGGGYAGRRHHNAHVAEAMKLADEVLTNAEIPERNTVYYSFHKNMPRSASLSQTQRPWAALIPYIPPYGTRTTQRIQAFPQYLTMPFRRLVRQHQRQGSSMLPCAVEYFQPSTRRLQLGRPVGLTGRAAHRMNRIRRGMPTYVWPTRPVLEHDLLRAGLTGLTDFANPALTWLPSGHARWVRPGTQPLDEHQWTRLANSTEEDHAALLKELQQDTPTWEACDASRRRLLVDEWRKRWYWSEATDDILKRSEDAAPPWAAPRLIGHRGCGKTSRPVLHPHSI